MTLPEKLPGHWTTPDGAEMAKRYVGVTRHQLFGGDFTDFEAAHRVAMTMRSDLDFEASLALARDRIRWLSVQLAVESAQANEWNKRASELALQRDGLVTALQSWKCSSCYGNGKFGAGLPVDTGLKCPTCRGDGLDPRASEALGKLPPAGLATTGGVSSSSTESARTPGEHMKRGEQ